MFTGVYAILSRLHGSFCGVGSGTNTSQQHAARMWYKFEKVRSDKTGHVAWQPREVALDMHDDANRVYTRIDHSLVIRDVQTGMSAST